VHRQPGACEAPIPGLLIPSIIRVGRNELQAPPPPLADLPVVQLQQSVSTVSSFYVWGCRGQLSALRCPNRDSPRPSSAPRADVAGAENLLVTGIKQQYLTVLQARAQADLAQKTLQRNEEFLKARPGALRRGPGDAHRRAPAPGRAADSGKSACCARRHSSA